jgi:L-ascorbate metabolism protein UlaG (beta-lactamase superfamily)
LPVSGDRKVYLKQNIQTEPLFNSWYAWVLLLPPATAALNLAERYLPMMKSYVTSPMLHAAAVKNPAMRGGPFIDLGGKRANEVRELMQETLERNQNLLEFAKKLKQLAAMLLDKAKGMALDSLYAEVPDLLKGYVELCYDLNHSPSFRVIEPMLYRSPYFSEAAQSVALSEVSRDRGRPFIMSTPRLADDRTANFRMPFSSLVLDDLFRMKSQPQSYAYIADSMGVDGAAEPLFRSFFTEDAPAPPVPYEGDSFRVRYFGHACLLIESRDVKVLVDPIVSYSYDAEIPRYTFADLPDEIDYVLITHSHHDHILLETLLQLRHKVKTIVVGRNYDGFLHDPSLQLALQSAGFPNVVEIRDLQEIPIPGGSIFSIPFLGEHHDLFMQSKSGYLVRIGKRSVLCIADACNLEPCMYEKVFQITGEPDLLFLGMECDGAPPSWIYGPLFPKAVPREIDQSRRARGCNFKEASGLVDRFRFRQAYVYAMGQEPWLSHILDNEFNEESNSLIQSRRFVAHCREKGIVSESLFGQKEILVQQD